MHSCAAQCSSHLLLGGSYPCPGTAQCVVCSAHPQRDTLVEWYTILSYVLPWLSGVARSAAGNNEREGSASQCRGKSTRLFRCSPPDLERTSHPRGSSKHGHGLLITLKLWWCCCTSSVRSPPHPWCLDAVCLTAMWHTLLFNARAFHSPFIIFTAALLWPTGGGSIGMVSCSAAIDRQYRVLH